MSLPLERLQENIVKTVKLESNIDHLSDRVEKLCAKIDHSLPLLEKINLRMEDDILRRAVSDKLLTKLSEDVSQINFIQRAHERKISEHDSIIYDLNRISENQKTIIKVSKIGWKVLVSVCIGAASLWGYIENQKDERHHEALISLQQIEEKKKRLEYNREKYLIRNGKWKDGEPKD
jgi:hypothetical protein